MPEKWKLVEDVVAEIEAMSNQGLDCEITRLAMVPEDQNPDRLREIDIVVRFPAGRRTLSIGISVKNEKRPIDVAKMESLISVWLKRKGSLDRYCIVSTGGFTANARADAEENGVELVHFREVEGGGKGWSRMAGTVRATSLSWEPSVDASIEYIEALKEAGTGDTEIVDANGRHVLYVEEIYEAAQKHYADQSLPGRGPAIWKYPFSGHESLRLVVGGRTWPMPLAVLVGVEAKWDELQVQSMHFRGLFEDGLKHVCSAVLPYSDGDWLATMVRGEPDENGRTEIRIRQVPLKEQKRKRIEPVVARGLKEDV